MQLVSFVYSRNPFRFMKKCTFLALLLTLSAAVSAQQDYFFAIEADKAQPFSVRIQDKNFSSSADGYLLIGKLKDTVYELKVNFPKNSFPEQTFKVAVNRKDKGFQLKKTGDQTWSLYNWQTMELIAAQSAEESAAEVKTETPKPTKPAVNGFANMMAAVVNDNDVLKDRTKTAVPPKDAPKQTTPANPPTPDVTVAEPAKPATKVIQVDPEPVKLKDSAEAAPASPVIKTISPTPEIVDKPTKDSTIAAPVKPAVQQPTAESSTSIPKDSLVAAPAKAKIESTTQTPEPVAVPKAKMPSIQIISDRTIDKGREIIYKAGDEDSITVIIPLDDAPKPVVKTGVDSTLSAKPTVDSSARADKSTGLLIATDLDLDKLRVQMMETATTDQRLLVAKKAFALKSYSTKQVKGLTELFYSEVFKFQFLESAYPTITDKEAFKELVVLFSQDYYIRKFQELVK